MKKTNPRDRATEAQIKANGANAQKSTGPRTKEGKAASSRNGLTHGLCADKHILPGEDPEEFLLLLKDLFDTFRPVGQGEEKLVLRVAAAQWRLDRALPMETGIYRQRLLEVAADDAEGQRNLAWQKEQAELQGQPLPPAPSSPDEGDLLARAFDADCVAPNSLAKLARYEGALERSIDRCLRQLKAFQATRLNPPGPPTPPMPPPGKDYEANPIHAGDTSEDFVEVLHFEQDGGTAGGTGFSRSSDETGFSRSGGTGFSRSSDETGFSRSGGTGFSRSGGTGFSRSGGTGFSQSGGTGFSQSGGTGFSRS